jgi:hypothetical protein
MEIDPLGSPIPWFETPDNITKTVGAGCSLTKLKLWNRYGSSIGHELPESRLVFQQRDKILDDRGAWIGRWSDWREAELALEGRLAEQDDFVSLRDLRIPPIASGQYREIEIRVPADSPDYVADVRIALVYG